MARMDSTPLLWTNLWELIKALLTAGAAYGTVYYGQRRLAMVDERKAEKDLTYLATIVSSDLERFLMECFTSHGMTASTTVATTVMAVTSSKCRLRQCSSRRR